MIILFSINVIETLILNDISAYTYIGLFYIVDILPKLINSILDKCYRKFNFTFSPIMNTCRSCMCFSQNSGIFLIQSTQISVPFKLKIGGYKTFDTHLKIILNLRQKSIYQYTAESLDKCCYQNIDLKFTPKISTFISDTLSKMTKTIFDKCYRNCDFIVLILFTLIITTNNYHLF